MNNYGLKEWDDVEIKQVNNNKNRRDLYMKLLDGSNVLRIVTKPHEYLVHFYKASEDDPGYGTRIMSSIYHGSDVLVDRGLKPKKRWLVGVIDRKTSSYRILDFSSSIFKSLQELVRDEDWGDPSQYDIDIKVDRKGGPTGYYTVVPKNKKPLSAADLDIKEQVDLEDLKRRCTPPPPEKVAELVKMVEDRSAGKSTDDGEIDETNDVDFPSVDGSDE